MEKRYNAREAALEVLKKTEQLLKSSKVLEKYETLNQKKPSKSEKKDEKRAEASDSKLDVEAGKSKGSDRVEHQVSPDKNAKEKAEGGNKPGGTVLKDAEKVSVAKNENEIGTEIPMNARDVGAAKLAKFLEGVKSKKVKAC
jgi:hypothetical protein